MSSLRINECIKWLWAASDGFRLSVVWCALTGALNVSVSLCFVFVCKHLIDIATDISIDSLGAYIGWMAICLTAQLVLSVIRSRLTTRTEVKLRNGLHNRLFEHLMKSQWNGREAFHSGDLLCLVCAVCYASYIVFTGSSLCGLNPVAVGVMQFLFMGLYSAAASLIAGGFTLPTSFVFWSSMAVMVVLGTAYCFIMQVISQQHVSATAAGITLSLEPVFSALFAYVTLGERLGLGQFAGAALMLGGVLWISTRER